MDEKKIVEALETLSKTIVDLKIMEDETNGVLSANVSPYETAIEALEKQLPKKPIEYEDKYYACPICGNVLMHKYEKYPTILADRKNGLPCCLSCLQVIDWSES